MKISIRGKIFLAFTLFICLSALIWARSYYSQYVLNQKIQIIVGEYDLFNAILEARRYEKNYFLSFDRKNIAEALYYVRQTEDILRNILNKYGKYTLAKNLDQRIAELVTYKEALSDLLKLHEEGHLVVPPDTIEFIRKQGRILTSNLRKIVKKESAFTRDLIGKSKTIHLLALIPVFILSVSIALFLNFNVNRPLKTIENAITKIASGDFDNIPEIKTGDEFESLVNSLNNMFDELNKRSRQLMKAKKLASLGRLTSGVAHELNNPLNNISTSLQILIEELEENDLEFKKELLTGAEKEVERGKEIVSSLLEFARERTLTLKQVNFKDLVDSAIQHIQSQIPDDIHFNIEVLDDIQAVMGPKRIERVLMNLIVNAVHAMKDGGDITIRAKNEWDENGFSFQVIDTGEGIPENIILKVFDPFFTTKEVGKGSGLGLSIIYGIMELHGGNISVSSEVGKGTTFTCFLPFNHPDQREL
ncbi:MAG: HAMP domain-containing histidine kinase [Deltaproteobacteria bacterium]|nr:HAMP domain-containing histidine kinase [Deltaproteobacteria bacterium]